MNILLVADVSISEIIGGAERVLFEQGSGLVKKGHEVHILTRKSQNHRTEFEEIEGVKEWRYPVKYQNSLSFLKTAFFNSKRLFESLNKKYSFDIINLHQPISAFGVLRSRPSLNIKKIYTCHSLFFEEFQSRNPKPKGFIHKAFYRANVLGRRLIEKDVLKKSDRIMVLSQYTEEKLLNHYKISSEKIKNITGGVDLNRFRPSPDKISLRKSLEIPPDKFILLTIRNLVQRMGLENLLYALKKIAKKVDNIYLVIGGEGPLKESLFSLTKSLGLEDCVRFAGYIKEEDLPAYYQMADLFILPTKELEGFGLVALEAMASGLPVLGTPVGGIKEILGRFDKIFLFHDTEPDSIADLTFQFYTKLKDNSELKSELSERCRDFMGKNYSWDRNINEVESLFLEVFKK